MSMYSKNHYNIVISLQLIKKKKKKRFVLEEFSGVSVDKNLLTNTEEVGSIPGPGRWHMPQSN